MAKEDALDLLRFLFFQIWHRLAAFEQERQDCENEPSPHVPSFVMRLNGPIEYSYTIEGRYGEGTTRWSPFIISSEVLI